MGPGTERPARQGVAVIGSVIELQDRGGACWECYIGRPKAERHLGCTLKDFYARPENQVRLF